MAENAGVLGNHDKKDKQFSFKDLRQIPRSSQRVLLAFSTFPNHFFGSLALWNLKSCGVDLLESTLVDQQAGLVIDQNPTTFVLAFQGVEFEVQFATDSPEPVRVTRARLSQVPTAGQP